MKLIILASNVWFSISDETLCTRTIYQLFILFFSQVIHNGFQGEQSQPNLNNKNKSVQAIKNPTIHIRRKRRRVKAPPIPKTTLIPNMIPNYPKLYPYYKSSYQLYTEYSLKYFPKFFLVSIWIVSGWNLKNSLCLFSQCSKVISCHLLGDTVRNFCGVTFLDLLLFEDPLCYFLDVIPNFLFGVLMVSKLNLTLLEVLSSYSVFYFIERPVVRSGFLKNSRKSWKLINQYLNSFLITNSRYWGTSRLDFSINPRMPLALIYERFLLSNQRKIPSTSSTSIFLNCFLTLFDSIIYLHSNSMIALTTNSTSSCFKVSCFLLSSAILSISLNQTSFRDPTTLEYSPVMILAQVYSNPRVQTRLEVEMYPFMEVSRCRKIWQQCRVVQLERSQRKECSSRQIGDTLLINSINYIIIHQLGEGGSITLTAST